MTNKFDNKVVVVTGGTSGIGLATAKAFAAEGASVFITGRRQEALDAAVKQIGGRVTGVRGDMSRLADIDRLYDAIQQKHSQIDVVFANAGGGEMAPLGTITEEHYQSIFDTNVKGVLFTVQKALPLLKDGASVILTGSTTSISGTPAFSVYSATKAAVRNFARNWILDLKDRRIRVNAIMPSAHTPLLDRHPDAAFRDWMRAHFPAERVAAMVAWLASPACAESGAVFTMGGGLAGRVEMTRAPYPVIADATPEAIAAVWVAGPTGNPRVLASQDDLQRLYFEAYPLA